MAEYRIEGSEPAENDLRDIVRHISAQLDAPVTAEKMLDVIEEAVNSLEDMAQRYPLVIDERLAAMGYRKLTVKNYFIFFTVDEKRKIVNVERILYARRDWRGLL